MKNLEVEMWFFVAILFLIGYGIARIDMLLIFSLVAIILMRIAAIENLLNK
jgi:hypothetical protein